MLIQVLNIDYILDWFIPLFTCVLEVSIGQVLCWLITSGSPQNESLDL